MSSALTDAQRAALRALCDTVVARIDRDDDPDGFWARTGSDVGADHAAEQLIAGLPEEQRAGLGQILDALAAQGFARATQRSREQLLRNIALLGAEPAAGIGALTGMALFLAYGVPDPATGQNPFWSVFGFPGPVSLPPAAPKPIAPVVPEGEELTLEGDVCVVGSGAGGGVIAGTLAAQGLKVVVLEAGGYFTEADFPQSELWGFQNMYWRGGPQATADLNISLQAGAALGGGTVINWTNCLRTYPWVREQWAREHGLEGVDTPEFDRHIDAIWQRSGVTGDCSDLNPAQERMKLGAERMGWSFRGTDRNTDPASYDPSTAGYIGFGDQSGSKRSVDKTFLRDAFEAGAEIVVRCHADRVLVEQGRAAGVEATYADPATGRTARVAVRAPQVVVACGSLESPALLLRSGIGGPAVGDHLRLHPCTALYGIYPEETRAWWGAPHAGLCDQFAELEDGYGFLVEGAQYTTALAASAMPFTDPREHKELMTKVRHGATFIGLLRDRGHGRVTIDRAGQPLPFYDLTDELDARNTRRALYAQARLHQAAGAVEIHALATGAKPWRFGDDVDAWAKSLWRVPLRAGGMKLFAAHQMGSCRMGSDPKTSVAGPWGELHDSAGVWIGDGSAFPTASGTNPMITIMALAHRTAGAIAAAAPSGAALQAAGS